jgi:hypothetical protein
MSFWFRARYSFQRRLPILRVGNGWIYVLIALWGTAVVAGIVKVWQYQLTPGATPAPAPSVWPVDSSIPAHSGRALLIMVAHPQCTCTRASLNELRRLMVRFRALKNPPEVYLSIIAPAGVGADWTDGPVMRNASSIRNLNIVIDPGERFARKFGATTSGHMLLYGADGRLLFSGGITDARAHEGDAAGQEAIVAALYEKTPAVTQTPVFGCALDKPVRPGTVSN